MNPEGIPEPGTGMVGRQRARYSYASCFVLSQKDHYGANTAVRQGERAPELDRLGFTPSCHLPSVGL